MCRDQAKAVNVEPLRGYQTRLIAAASSGSGNHIIVLPTGTGKTRIAVELGRQLLEAQAKSRIVFLVPTVTLAEQQAGKGPSGHTVNFVIP